MLSIKIIIYMFIFLTSSSIGILKSKKYVNRVNELKEFNNALNVFKAKIRFTYEPIPEIFNEISENTGENTGLVFKTASNIMKSKPAGEAWYIALESNELNINNEDKDILKNLSKLLGETDAEGQLSQIELTQTFITDQIDKAESEKEKNEKLYKTFGMVIGLTIVIILM